MRERQLKLIIETGDITTLAPSAVAYFKLHRCENKDVNWKMILTNKMASVIQVTWTQFYKTFRANSVAILALVAIYLSQIL